MLQRFLRRRSFNEFWSFVTGVATSVSMKQFFVTVLIDTMECYSTTSYPLMGNAASLEFLAVSVFPVQNLQYSELTDFVETRTSRTLFTKSSILLRKIIRCDEVDTHGNLTDSFRLYAKIKSHSSLLFLEN